MALVPVGKICGAKVADGAGEAAGTITEIMLDADSGGVAYAVLAHGGIGGVGEKLFALPWRRLRCHGDGVVVDVAAARFAEADGFDKDAWPTDADRRFD